MLQKEGRGGEQRREEVTGSDWILFICFSINFEGKRKEEKKKLCMRVIQVLYFKSKCKGD